MTLWVVIRPSRAAASDVSRVAASPDPGHRPATSATSAAGGLGSVTTSSKPLSSRTRVASVGVQGYAPHSTVRRRANDSARGSADGLTVAKRTQPPGRNDRCTRCTASGITGPGMNALGIHARSKACVSVRSWTDCSRSSMRASRPALFTLPRASARAGAQTSRPTTRRFCHSRAISMERAATPTPTSRNRASSPSRRLARPEGAE